MPIRRVIAVYLLLFAVQAMAYKVSVPAEGVLEVCSTRVQFNEDLPNFSYYASKLKINRDSCTKAVTIKIEFLGEAYEGYPELVRSDQKNEYYEIIITDDVVIRSATRSGFIRATEQLSIELENQYLKKGLYKDYPDYPWRGVITATGYMNCSSSFYKNREYWLTCQEEYFKELSKNKINKIGIASSIWFDAPINKETINNLITLSRKYGLDLYPVIGTKLWSIPENKIPLQGLEGIKSEKQYTRDNDGLIAKKTDSKLLLFDFKNGFDIGVRNILTGWKVSDEKESLIYLHSQSRSANSARLVLDNKLPLAHSRQYEIGIKARRKGLSTARVAVYVQQYNAAGEILFGYTYIPKYWLGENWSIQWASLFVSPEAKSISFEITPYVSGDGEIEIDWLEINSSEGELINVLNNEETKPELYSLAGKKYLEGKDYEVVVPSIKQQNNKQWLEIDRSVVRLTKETTIPMGEELVLFYDRLPLMYRSFPMTKLSVNSKYTIDFFSQLLTDLRPYKFKYIHVAFDEHLGGLNRDARSSSFAETNADAFSKFINRVNGLVRQDLGGESDSTKLIIWDDMINEYHNGKTKYYQTPAGGVLGSTALKNQSDAYRLSQDILINSWWYEKGDKWKVIEEGGAEYRRRGYKFIASVYSDPRVIKDWLSLYSVNEMHGVNATYWSKSDKKNDGYIGCIGWSSQDHNVCEELIQP